MYVELDSLGLLLEVVEHYQAPDSAKTKFERDFEGRVKKVTFPEGNYLQFAYNSANDLAEVSNNLNQKIKFTRDIFSRNLTTEIRRPSGQNSFAVKTESYKYGTRGLLSVILHSSQDSTVFAVDGNVGDITGITSPNGFATTFQFDDLRRVTSMVQGISSASTATTVLSYDRDNNITKIIDPKGSEHRFVYDDRNLVIYDSSGEAGVSRFYYGGARELLARSNRAAGATLNSDSMTISYDAMLRPVSVVNNLDASQNISYTYDDHVQAFGRGRLYQETSPETVTRYEYDGFGRVKGESRQIYNVWQTTNYYYDKNGELSEMWYPSGTKIHYNRNSIREVTGVNWSKQTTVWFPLAKSVHYVPFGGIDTLIYGNDMDTWIDYDLQYRPREIQTLDYFFDGIDGHYNNKKFNWTYWFDHNGNITSMVDSVTPSDTRNFTYDGIDRLLTASSADYSGGSFAYSYAPNGDRLTESRNGGSPTNYNYTANRLTSLSGAQTANFYHNHRGNDTLEVAGGTTRSFQYDFLGRLRSINNETGGRYRYDSRSLRFKTRLGTSARASLYNLAGQLIEEVDSVQNKWIADYVYLNGRLLAKLTPTVPVVIGGGDDFMMSGGLGGGDGESDSTGMTANAAAGGGGTDSTQYANVFYYHLDHLGTPWFMTNKFQTTVWEGEYFPFGELYTQTVSEPNAFRFPGQYDDNTGMYYNWHRFYDPKLGRYRQTDPIGVAGGVNVYGYAGGNALSFSDHFGLSPRISFWDKVWKNYDETDQGISSLVRAGLSTVLSESASRFLGSHYSSTINVATSTKTAAELSVPTLLEWLWDRAPRISGVYGTYSEARLISGLYVVRSTAINYLLAQGAWRGGVLIGSILSTVGDEVIKIGNDPCERK